MFGHGLGSNVPFTPMTSSVLSDILGKALPKKEAQQIVPDIETAFAEYEGHPIATVKQSFLGTASKMPRYGYAFFPAKVRAVGIAFGVHFVDLTSPT